MGYIIALADSAGKPDRYIRDFNGNNYSRFDLSITENREEAFVYNHLELCKNEAHQFRALGLNVKVKQASAVAAQGETK